MLRSLLSLPCSPALSVYPPFSLHANYRYNIYWPSEFFSASPAKTQRVNSGSGLGVAAAASGTGARMGGGPPALGFAGLDLLGGGVQQEGGAGYMDEMLAIFGGGKVLA